MILFIYETIAIKHNFETNHFCAKFFTTPNLKNIIATLRTVTIGKSELTFLLI